MALNKFRTIGVALVVFLFGGTAVLLLIPEKPQLSIGLSSHSPEPEYSPSVLLYFTNHSAIPLKCWWEGDWFTTEDGGKLADQSGPLEIIGQSLILTGKTVTAVSVHNASPGKPPISSLQIHFSPKASPIQLRIQKLLQQLPGLNAVDLTSTGAVLVKFPTASSTNVAPFQ